MGRAWGSLVVSGGGFAHEMEEVVGRVVKKIQDLLKPIDVVWEYPEQLSEPLDEGYVKMFEERAVIKYKGTAGKQLLRLACLWKPR
jgi:hypothetical protein